MIYKGVPDTMEEFAAEIDETHDTIGNYISMQALPR